MHACNAARRVTLLTGGSATACAALCVQCGIACPVQLFGGLLQRAHMPGACHGALLASRASMKPRSACTLPQMMERITSLCVTSMIVQGLRMVRLGAEVLLRGSSGFGQPTGKLCMAVILPGAGMERWQGGRAVECCTCVAAGGVLRLMRELAGCLLRPPSLHCKDP